MLGNKNFNGLALSNEYIKLARLRVEGKKVRLTRVDRLNLIDEVEASRELVEETVQEKNSSEPEAVFGFEEDTGSNGSSDSEDMADESGDDDIMSLDVDEGEAAIQSNEMLLHNLFVNMDNKRIDMGLNIAAGNTIFQTLRDDDYDAMKTKELKGIIEDKLESIYGEQKSEDQYAYEIRNDGALILASNDGIPTLLDMVDGAREIFDGKLFIDNILPDEVILTGLVRANYTLEDNEVTAVIQFSDNYCRVIFLKGDQIWLVSPIINEGTQSKNFLNTVFSKILFQLDTGEVPNMDRIILADNTIGEEAVDFFKRNFPDLEVGNFRFNPDKFIFDELNESSVNAFTTAIGSAWAASNIDADAFPSLSFLPSYVTERQKVFKLQWHGFVLLLLIFLTPMGFNYFYQKNLNKINNLETELVNAENKIDQVQPTVDKVNNISEDLTKMQTKLALIDTLGQNSRKWSETLHILNTGIQNVNSTWITSMRSVDNGIQIQGYSLYRNRLPQLTALFDKALLENVTTDRLRDKQVYKFAITITSIVKDKTRFGTPQAKELKKLLSGS